MNRFHPPKELLGGRVRTSTVALSLLFVALLVLYLNVRPPPDRGTNSPAVPTEREETTPPTETPPPEPSATGTARPDESTPERSPGAGEQTPPGGESGSESAQPEQPSPSSAESAQPDTPKE
jgi:hypothetical protein